MFMGWREGNKLCGRKVLFRYDNSSETLSGRKVLRVGEDQPTLFSHDDAFVLQLLHQATEMLRRKGQAAVPLPNSSISFESLSVFGDRTRAAIGPPSKGTSPGAVFRRGRTSR